MKCQGCDYSIGVIHKGYCEICRKDFGRENNKFAQKESKKVYHEFDVEEMTDGEYIARFGYARYQKEEENEK